MLPKKVSLKNTVVRDEPMIGFRNCWFNNCGSNGSVVVRREVVANVVHECAQNVFFVAAVTLGACCGLEAVLKTINRKAAVVVTQIFELFNQAIGDAGLSCFELNHDVVPVGFCRLGERCELCSCFLRGVSGLREVLVIA